MMNTS